MKKVLIITMCLYFISCMDSVDNNYLKIENNSKDSIYIIFSKNDIIFNYEKFEIMNRIEKGDHFTSVDFSDKEIFTDVIQPDTIIEEKGYRSWKSALKNKKLRLYVIKKDSVDKYDWKGIHDRNLYNKKYTLDIHDLDSLNWIIQYNGN